MKEVTSLATRRRASHLSVASIPMIKEKQINSKEAIAFLNEFVKDARKEIRMREKLTLRGRIEDADCTAMSFIGDNFSLTIDFTEGFAL